MIYNNNTINIWIGFWLVWQRCFWLCSSRAARTVCQLRFYAFSCICCIWLHIYLRQHAIICSTHTHRCLHAHVMATSSGAWRDISRGIATFGATNGMWRAQTTIRQGRGWQSRTGRRERATQRIVWGSVNHCHYLIVILIIICIIVAAFTHHSFSHSFNQGAAAMQRILAAG